jgi:putative transposase
VRRVCRVLQRPRSVYEYKSRKDEQAVLRMRIKDIAQARVSYGYRRIHVLLLREGWKVNHKRVYRLYKLGRVDDATEETQEACLCLSAYGKSQCQLSE